jgi:hypothetical protein
MSATKLDLHKLIDEIPEYEHTAVADYLKRLRELANDPVYQAFMNAPIDDEPLTPEERAAIEEGKREVREGRGVSWEGAQKELFDDEPLTAEDLAAINEAQAEVARGEFYSLEDIRQDLRERREGS